MSTNSLAHFRLQQLVRRLLPVTTIALALAASMARAQSVPVPFASTLAGGGTVCSGSLAVFAVTGTGAKFGDGCPATQATLSAPVAVASDSNGNVFIADQTNALIRVVYNGGSALAAAIVASNIQNTNLVPQKGNIYTIAGGVTSSPTEGTKYCNQAASGTIGTDSQLDGCPGAESFEAPRGLAVDADGNVFIASVAATSSLRVLYVGGTAAAKLITLENPSITSPLIGYVYNLAGTSMSSYLGDGGLASKATLNTPRGIFIDSAENVYFADNLNNVIRRIDSSTGFISTIAGHCVANGTNCTATATSGDGLSATNSAVNIDLPYGVVLDQFGNLFIAEGGSATVPGRIRVVYAGGTLPGITTPVIGNIYTYAGGASGTTPAQLTAFQEVFGVSIDPAGYLYVTDFRTASSGSNHIWRVDPTNGNIASIAGNSGTTTLTVGAHCNGGTTGPVNTNKYGDNCPATQAYLNTPQETLAFDGHGNFYLADRGNNLVRSFTYNNAFPTTALGSSVTQPLAFLYAAGSLPISENFTIEGNTTADYSDGGGDTCALNTTLVAATTCVDFVKFAPSVAGQRSGSLSVTSANATIGTQTLVGIGAAPVLTISPATIVTLGSNLQPLSVSTDQLGNVNISDGKGKQVLRTAIAGGTPIAYISALGMPRQTSTDSYGNIFVADSVNNTVVERTPTSVISSIGNGLSAPQGVAADQFGNIYVADTGNNRLVYISPLTGNQRTIPLSGFILNAPTYLALDPAGDLFVIDTNNTRVIEVPLDASAQLITLPTGATPAAIAFDTGGNSYLADKASGNILFVPVGSTAATNLIPGLTAPAGVAVDPSGNVFVADSSATSATGYNVALNTSTFTTTNIGLASLPITLTLADVGNLSATLSTPTFIETGDGAAFPSIGTPACTPALVLAPATTCTQAFVFQPTVPGAQSAKAVFTTTTAQSVTANFSATATNLIPTAIAIDPLDSTANYGQTVTYTVTLTPKSTGSAAPTGTVSFVVDGKTVATQNVSANPYTFTPSTGVAIHSIAAVYSGDAIYAGNNVSTFLTVSKATTATVASITPVSTNGVGALLLTAKLTTTGTGTPSGTITFINGTTTLATVNLSTAVNGVVTFTTSTVNFTNPSFTATYSGDGLFAPSSSTTTEGADFVVVAPAAALSVPQGGQAVESITVTPINGYTGTLTASCSNLPTNAICRFLPIPASLTTTASTTLTVQVFAGINPNVASLAPSKFDSKPETMLALLLLTPAVFGLRRRRSDGKRHSLPHLLVLTLLAVLTSGLAGCGGKTPASVQGSFPTPVGTTAVTVTLTDTNNRSRSAVINVNVTGI